MKKRLAIGTGIIGVILCGILLYLQFGREMDVGNTRTMTAGNYYRESIDVYLNRLLITDSQEEIAEEIIERCVENQFPSVNFSYDLGGYPNELQVKVYQGETSKQPLFSFVYQQKEGYEMGTYDIRDAKYMELEMKE